MLRGIAAPHKRSFWDGGAIPSRPRAGKPYFNPASIPGVSDSSLNSARVFAYAYSIESDRLRAARVGLGGVVLDRRQAARPPGAPPLECLPLLAGLRKEMHQSVAEDAIHVGSGVAVSGRPRRPDAAGRQSPDAMSGDASLVANDEVTDITFKNTYVADAALTLDGAKRWDDLDNAFETRPDELDLTLTRKTASQPEETIALTGDNLTWKRRGGSGRDSAQSLRKLSN